MVVIICLLAIHHTVNNCFDFILFIVSSLKFLLLFWLWQSIVHRPFLVISYFNSDTWNTSCIFYLVGNSNLYILTFLLRGGPRTVRKTYSQAFCLTSFCCIYYTTRLSHPKYSYDSLLSYHWLSSTALVHRIGFSSKLLSALLALQLAC